MYVPPSSQKATNPYETVTSLHEYLLMHYGTAKELISFEGVVDAPLHSLQFPKDCANVCMELAKKPHLANKQKVHTEALIHRVTLLFLHLQHCTFYNTLLNQALQYVT